MPRFCSHHDLIRTVTPSALGREECRKNRELVVHLRICRSCGHVGRCDQSPGKHATKHFQASRHPIIEGYDHQMVGAGVMSTRHSSSLTIPRSNSVRYRGSQFSGGSRRFPDDLSTPTKMLPRSTDPPRKAALLAWQRGCRHSPFILGRRRDHRPSMQRGSRCSSCHRSDASISARFTSAWSRLRPTRSLGIRHRDRFLTANPIAFQPLRRK